MYEKHNSGSILDHWSGTFWLDKNVDKNSNDGEKKYTVYWSSNGNRSHTLQLTLKQIVIGCHKHYCYCGVVVIGNLLDSMVVVDGVDDVVVG